MNALLKNGAKVFGKAALATIALGGFFLFAGASSAQAHDWDHCGRGTGRAQWKLHEAIEHHGFYSRQADHWRHELQEEQERCWRERREHEWREHQDDDRRYHRDRD